MKGQLPHTVREDRGVEGGRRVTLEFGAGRAGVPAVLLRPNAPGVVGAALLLHGYSSRKEVMADTLGAALLRRGVASLALDLPLHGARGDPLQLQALRSPLEAVRAWRLALREAALGVRFLRELPDVNAARVGVVGYSLGSFLATMLAGSHPEVGAVVLAAGGDLPSGTPLAAVARSVVDPLRAVKRFGGRPLLMVNGRHDPVIRAEQAQRLFDAAREPKELRWWNVGHTLHPEAVEYAADWLARRLAQTN